MQGNQAPARPKRGHWQRAMVGVSSDDLSRDSALRSEKEVLYRRKTTKKRVCRVAAEVSRGNADFELRGGAKGEKRQGG